MRRLVLLVVLLLGIVIDFTDSIANDLNCETLQSVEQSALPDHLDYYFLTRNILPNNPDFDELQLNYINATGAFPLDVMFSPSQLVSISPSGDYFVVIEGQGDAFYQSPGSFSYRWEQVQSPTIITVEDMAIHPFDFLADIDLDNIMLHINWINDAVFDLLQTNDEGVSTVRIDLAKDTVSIMRWDLPNLELDYAEGRIFLSPNGQYVFYTSDISNEFPRQDITQAWSIAKVDEVIVAEDIALYSQSVTWLPDNTGIIFTTTDHTPMRYMLDGDLTSMPYETPQRPVLQSVISNDLRVSAHVIGRPENADALMFVDWIEGMVWQSCEDFITLDIRSFSPDAYFLPMVVSDGDATALNFVDMVAHEMIVGASYPASTRIFPLGWGIQPSID